MSLRAAVLAVLLCCALPAESARADDSWQPAEPTWGSVTAYCDQGVTASGAWTRWGTAAGAGWLPLGSLVWVPGYGTVLITDRGQPGLFIVDIAAPGACGWAWQWGRQWLPVSVERWGWGWQ
jgi:3D (Asp-Asp-Asp) domain-containing protein